MQRDAPDRQGCPAVAQKSRASAQDLEPALAQVVGLSVEQMPERSAQRVGASASRRFSGPLRPARRSRAVAAAWPPHARFRPAAPDRDRTAREVAEPDDARAGLGHHVVRFLCHGHRIFVGGGDRAEGGKKLTLELEFDRYFDPHRNRYVAAPRGCELRGKDRVDCGPVQKWVPC